MSNLRRADRQSIRQGNKRTNGQIRAMGNSPGLMTQYTNTCSGRDTLSNQIINWRGDSDSRFV